MPDEPVDLVALLRHRAIRQADAVGYVFATDDGEESPASYAWLDRRARAVAATLAASGIGAGQRAMLMFAPGADYVAGFFGCLYAGVVAVPVYPPDGPRGMERVAAVLADCAPAAILSTSDIIALAGGRVAGAGPRWMATDTVDDAAAGQWSCPAIGPDTLAFLQYTSGSTATPKGVMLTHANLLHNSAVIARAVNLGPHSRAVSWLPPYHDMGLIGGVLQPLYGGFPCVLMPPSAFLRRPRRWLEAISRHRATISAAPDFAYLECVRRVPPQQRSGLDLSSWAHALVGAEPVRPATLAAFTEAFAGCGLPATSLYPCYGLAEATLFVTGGPAGEPARTLSVDRDLVAAGAARPVPDGTGIELTSCGHTHGPDTVRVVDPLTRTACESDVVGEIWVSGPTVAAGYWNAADRDDPVFGLTLQGEPETFLRTGDLGFLHEGDLFITGRVKDVLVVRGRNHHPQDLELTAEGAHPLLRPHRGAAFVVDTGGAERVVLVHEVTREFRPEHADGVRTAISAAVVGEHGLSLGEVVLVRGGAIPRTSSGKIRRAACRAAYLAGGLEPPFRAGETPAATARAGGSGRDGGLVSSAGLALRLAGVVARVLDTDPAALSATDTLVGLGLDSLRGMELRAMLADELGLEVPVDRLLGGLSLGALLAEAATGVWDRSAGGGRSAGGDRPGQAAGEVPASAGQQRLWLLHRAEPGSSAYHVGAGAHLAGPFDPERFTDALRGVQGRHAALRTTVVLDDDDGVLRQRVCPDADLEVERIDLGALPPADRDAAAARHAAELVARPFDLASRPPVRAAVLRLSDREHHVILAAHHIIVDAGALEVIFTELAALYRGAVAGVAAPLPAAPQYPDWSAAQREALTAQPLPPDLAYWRERLAGTEPLRLPDPTSTVDPAGSPPRVPVELPAPLVARLRAAAKEAGCTPFMVLLAAFAAVLSRWSGQPDVVVATPLSGRDRPGTTGLVGFVSNTVALRIPVRPAAGVAELLATVREVCLGGYAHGGVPYDRVIEAVRPDRSTGRAPVAQAMFAMRRLPAPARLADGLTARVYEVPNADAQFDLALHLTESGGEISGFALGRSGRFAAADLDRLVRGYLTLLDAALARPAIPVGRLPVQPPEDRRLIGRLARGPVVTRDALCLHQLVERQVDATPEAVAVVFEGRHVTYAELDRRANRLAHRLIEAGVGAERLVGICVPRCVEMVVALLAVLKAGGAYVPLDPEYPRARLEHMLTDAGAAQVLAAPEVIASGLLDGCGARVLAVGAGDGYPEHRPAVGVSPDNLAYVIYTSGSTGNPKGAMNAHRGVVNRILWGQRYFGLAAGEAVLQKTPLSFDVSGWELYWPLSTGARLVLARPGGHREADYLVGLIRAEGVTTVQFVPSMLRTFLAQPAVGECAAVLRRIICSGEALPPALADAALGRLPGVALFDLYGPTEAAIEVTAWDCQPGAGLVPIGHPIDNARIHVLDPSGEPTPVGVPGELHIGGVPVARGYWRRPALTAQRFVPDPFGRGTRLYRTGDLARVLPDGAVDYLGRLDQQVKIRGVRVELGEIEAALASHPGIDAAAVDARPGPGDLPRLVAYLAGAAPLPSSAQLRRYLADRLPPAMLPAAYVAVPALPLGPSGKLDRAALPEPDDAGHHGGYIAPGTPVEQILTEIWAQVLQVERVGTRDDFFELGGHSLLATQVLARVRAAFGVEPPVAELLSGRPTVERLAEVILQQQLASADADELLALIAEIGDDEAGTLARGPHPDAP